MLRRVSCYWSSLAQLNEYAQANKLLRQGKHEQASGYFQSCLDILSCMPPDASIFSLYQQAVSNEVRYRNYQRAQTFLNKQLHLFPEKARELFLTANILATVTKSRTDHLLTEANRDLEPLALAVQNILEGHDAPLIHENDLPERMFQTNCRASTIVTLSNYLTLDRTHPQKNAVLMEPVLRPSISYLNYVHYCRLDPKDMLLDQQALIAKLTTEEQGKLLYAMCYAIFNSGSFSNKVISLWLNIFLKFCEAYQPGQLYRPLYMLGVFYKNNGKPMVAEGLFNGAADKVDAKLHPDEHRLILMSKADLIVENEKRVDEAQQLRQQNASGYDFRKVLLQMII